MFRVTNRMLYNNTLVNVFRQNRGLLKAQEELASGKRVNRPSDDPSAIRQIIRLRLNISRVEKYVSIGQKAEASLNVGDSLVDSARELAVRGKELAMSQVGGAASAQTRMTTAIEISNMLARAIQIGNSSIGSDYIFGGRQTDVPPLDSSGLYQGDYLPLSAEVSENSAIDMSLLASQFLAADLSPQLGSATPLSALNGGQGVSAGTFTITDRVGVVGTVTVSTGDSVGNVIAAINASGANVTASISPDGMSLRIVDNNGVATLPLVIADTSGNAASALGIAGSRPSQTFTGDNLNPALATGALLADLYAGNGITMNDITVRNGAASATVTFSGATTVGDVVNAINASSANVTASINSNGSALTITSNDSATVAYAVDANQNRTAEMLGIGGGRNLIQTLQRLEQALSINDVSAIAGLLENLDSAVDTTAALRGDVGARTNRVLSLRSSLEQTVYDTTIMLSNIQDADMVKAASDLALLQTAYQATIQSAAAIIQPSLLDFLR